MDRPAPDPGKLLARGHGVGNGPARGDQHDANARRLVEHMALALEASLLIRHAPAAVAEGFCAARLEHEHGLAFGTLPAGLDLEAIIERARPLAA